MHPAGQGDSMKRLPCRLFALSTAVSLVLWRYAVLLLIYSPAIVLWVAATVAYPTLREAGIANFYWTPRWIAELGIWYTLIVATLRVLIGLTGARARARREPRGFEVVIRQDAGTYPVTPAESAKGA